MTIALPGVTEARDQVLRHLRDGKSMVAITGAAGAGKSATLKSIRSLGNTLPWTTTVFVTPPRADDAGPIALLEAAAQLGAPQSALMQLVRDIDRPWADKVDAVVSELTAKADKTLLLLDDPFSVDSGFYSSSLGLRADTLEKTIAGIPGLHTVVATSRPMAFARANEVRVRTTCNAAEVLEPSTWGSLAPFASALAAEGSSLPALSPLELRLRVALVALGSPPKKAATVGGGVRNLVDRLFALFPPNRPGALKEFLGKLALVRTPFEETLLKTLGASALEETEYQIVRSALLFGDSGQLQLHEAIVREANEREWIRGAARRDAHELLAKVHETNFEKCHSASQSAPAIRQEAEVIHHLTEAGDVQGLLAKAVYFIEQYNALGRVLSVDRRYADAASVYERSLAHDPNDDYANHYLAYNLDVLAAQPARVESHFQRALEQRPEHPWYWTRFINFLITRGRTSEARRQWENALEALASSRDDERFFRELHGEVARLLLHRGQTAFSSEVLDDITPGIAERPWASSLRLLLVQLQEAARDEVVFPPHVDARTRWDSPHLLLPNEEPSAVTLWMPGRVASVDDAGVHIRVGRATGTEVEYGWIDLSEEAFSSRFHSGVPGRPLPAGSFIELLTFASGTDVIRVHTRSREALPDLPPLFPHPDRYIRRAS